MKLYRSLILRVLPLVLVSLGLIYLVGQAESSDRSSDTPTVGPCSFSNGGLNPQPFTESNLPAPAGHMWSELQHDAGNTTQANGTLGVWADQVADDFTITTTCTISTMSFYTFTTTAFDEGVQVTGLRLRIWRGVPGEVTSSLLFGDATTNRLASTEDTGYLRILNSVVPPPGPEIQLARKIWRNTANVGVTLSPGTYWIEWITVATRPNGSRADTFQPTKTIPGSRGAPDSNARAFFLTFSPGWAPVTDIGVPFAPPGVAQDFPFDVVGTPAPPLPTPTPTPESDVFMSFAGPAVTIPGGPGIGGELYMPFVVGSACTISDVNFRFDGTPNGAWDATNVGLNRGWIGLAAVELVSPARTTVTLKSHTGVECRNNHLSQVTFDDDGGHPAIESGCDTAGGSEAAFPSGTYKPSTPLSAFDGESAGGTWHLRVWHTLINPGSVRAFTILFSCANDASVEVSGRVVTPDGRALRGATVAITDPVGNRRTGTTGSFGFYSFENVPVGSTYTISAASKRYRFSPRVVNVTNTLTNVDLVGLE